MNIPKQKLYMDIVTAIAQASHSTRAKVGALLERDGNIIAFGYNGMPAGFENECESRQCVEGMYGAINAEYVTKAEVLHAESNAIAKCAKSTASSLGCTLYCTYAPCLECAKLIIQSGIRQVVFEKLYRDPAGLELLMQAKIPYFQYEDTGHAERPLPGTNVVTAY
jgi:dCMP deaminase